MTPCVEVDSTTSAETSSSIPTIGPAGRKPGVLRDGMSPSACASSPANEQSVSGRTSCTLLAFSSQSVNPLPPDKGCQKHTDYIPHFSPPNIPDQRLAGVVCDDREPLYCRVVQQCFYILNYTRNRKSMQVPLHHSRDYVKELVSAIERTHREERYGPGTLNAWSSFSRNG